MRVVLNKHTDPREEIWADLTKHCLGGRTFKNFCLSESLKHPKYNAVLRDVKDGNSFSTSCHPHSTQEQEIVMTLLKFDDGSSCNTFFLFHFVCLHNIVVSQINTKCITFQKEI